MIILIPNVDKAFRIRFAYPVMMGHYSHPEYLRLTKLSNIWYKVHIVLFIFFLLAITVALTIVLQWLYIRVMSLMPITGTLYFQGIVVFAIPAVIISLPLSFLLPYTVIHICNPTDYDGIVDLMNVRYKYDSIRGAKWLLKVLIVPAGITMLVVSWTYMTVAKDGITIKNTLSLTPQHYNYSDIKKITHYKYATDPKDGIYLNDHYEILLKDGRDFFRVAPYVDNANDYATQIIKLAGMKVYEDSVSR